MTSGLASEASPLWHDIATVVNETIQTLAILIAGAVGYVRFVRGRVLHANLALSIEPEIIEVMSSKAIRVTATIKNTGTYRMTFPLTCQQLLKVEYLSRDVWTEAVAKKMVNWSEAEGQETNLLKVGDITYADDTKKFRSL